MNAEDFARKVAATFGVSPKRVGREWRVPCPVHEADGCEHNPSLAIWPKGDRYAWKCMTGCHQHDVAEALRFRGVAVGGHGPLSLEKKLKLRIEMERQRQNRLLLAQELIGTAHLIGDDHADAYLLSRGIDISGIDTSRDTLLSVNEPFGMLGVICDLRSILDRKPRVVGASVLPLSASGEPRIENGRKYRTIIGQQKGYAVPYGDCYSDTVIVAEGIESMLSAMLLDKVPFGAATLSANNMPNLMFPSHVRRVLIASDNDDAGHVAADRLHRALRLCGLDVSIRSYGTEKGWDANDEWRIKNVH